MNVKNTRIITVVVAEVLKESSPLATSVYIFMYLNHPSSGYF